MMHLLLNQSFPTYPKLYEHIITHSNEQKTFANMNLEEENLKMQNWKKIQ